MYIVGSYRQWNSNATQGSYTSKSNEDQIFRLRELIKIWTNVHDKGEDWAIMGDLNLDQWLENDPITRLELKDLLPHFEHFVLNTGQW